MILDKLDEETRSMLRHGLFAAAMWSWCLPQTLVGLGMRIFFRKQPRDRWHGASVIYHNGHFGGVSMGMYTFVNGRYRNRQREETRLHEYGHCIQSLLLGPLFLPVIALPSSLWCNLPVCERYRQRTGASYYDFYTEKWANRLSDRFITQRAKAKQEKKQRPPRT